MWVEGGQNRAVVQSPPETSETQAAPVFRDFRERARHRGTEIALRGLYGVCEEQTPPAITRHYLLDSHSAQRAES